MCYMSRDFREGLDAFLNKRPPQWEGDSLDGETGRNSPRNRSY